MVNITDACEWFLQKGNISNKQLQKLCYYTQAWSYALKDQPLIYDANKPIEFQAWVHGPVYPPLYHKYSSYGWKDIPPEGKNLNINKEDLDLLDSVWLTYGDLSGNAIEALSHTEPPWRNARGNLRGDEPSANEISIDDMKRYYRSIYMDD